jgi:hypothetical protein
MPGVLTPETTSQFANFPRRLAPTYATCPYSTLTSIKQFSRANSPLAIAFKHCVSRMDWRWKEFAEGSITLRKHEGLSNSRIVRSWDHLLSKRAEPFAIGRRFASFMPSHANQSRSCRRNADQREVLPWLFRPCAPNRRRPAHTNAQRHE